MDGSESLGRSELLRLLDKLLMDNLQLKTKPMEDDPPITMPLSEFLKILWGYKKGAELRNRAAPDLPVIEALKKVPNYQNYVHIQESQPSEQYHHPQVWQKAEWKESGEREVAKKKFHEQQNFNVDTIADAIYKKLPMLGKDFIRTLAHNVCNAKDFSSLKMFGIEEKDLKL